MSPIFADELQDILHGAVTDQLDECLSVCPIVASVQAPTGSPLANTESIVRLAEASLSEGVRVLRLEGIENIHHVHATFNVPIIGLIKRGYPGSEVFITATKREVCELLESDCKVIALDGTERSRSDGSSLAELVAMIHSNGKLAIADCDTVKSVEHSAAAKADLIGTTLAGYTADSPHTSRPDLAFLRKALAIAKRPVLAEGRYSRPEEVHSALRMGAKGVVIGGALNDPIKQTRTFVRTVENYGKPVGAVDIGGTWLRFAVFTPDWKRGEIQRTPYPLDPKSRLAWIQERCAESGVERVGLSAGGMIDPKTAHVWRCKPIMPNHEGTTYTFQGVNVFALNDGIASAWAHACHPDYAGLRVATIAIGTGVGFGLVDCGRIECGRRGDTIRLNDTPTAFGRSFEDLLGGVNLTANPTAEQKEMALLAGKEAAFRVRELFYPDEIVLAGTVAMNDWFEIGLPKSPFGSEAGLFGAAALALFPPPGIEFGE